MQQKQMWITLTAGLIYVVAAMWVMLSASVNRIVTIEDVTQEQMLSEAGGNNGRGTKNSWKKLKLAPGETTEEELIIPLEQGTKAENVTIENDYMDKEIWIAIDGADKYFYTENVIAGNLSFVESAIYERRDGVIQMRFRLDGVYECKSILEENKLYIELVKPKELYEKIVVVDPWYGENGGKTAESNSKEQEITLDIAKRIEEKMKASDFVKVYYTRMDEKAPSTEECMNIIAETEADLYIGITLNTDSDTSVYGVETVYNGTYFIPSLGSVQLADILVRNVTKQVSGRANGLTQAREEDIIVQKAKVPAAVLKAGYLSNEKEAELLNSEEYRDRIAEGISAAIQEACEMLEKQETE